MSDFNPEAWGRHLRSLADQQGTGPMRGAAPMMLDGMRIIQNPLLVDLVEDWSRVRSKARAERRRRCGFQQNIVYREVPKPDVYRTGNTLIMHPETAKELFRLAAAKEPRT